MKLSQSAGRKQVYSQRSQFSWREQWRLEEDLSRCAGWIVVCEGNVARLKETVARLTDSMVKGAPVFPANLGDVAREMEDEQRKLKVLKAHTAEVRSQIKSLTQPSRSQAAARRKQQIALGSLASKRLEADRTMDLMIDNLRRLLEVRKGLSAKMHAAAAAIDLKGASDFLDESRFDRLLDALPSDMAATSERWAERFAGVQRGKKRYIVLSARLTLEENLADARCYVRGDSVKLCEEEAAELLAKGAVDYPEGEAPEQEEAAEVGAPQD